MTALLDLERPDDAHTAARLSREAIVWFGTTGADQRPHRVPVWFYWSDPLAVVFSGAGTRKLRHIARVADVALSLDSAAGGTDVVLLDGRAEARDDTNRAIRRLTPGFEAK